MRSPSPRAWLLALVVLLAASNIGFAFHRSGIATAFAGRVERIEVRREKHPGLDDVHLVTVAGRTTHLDAEVAALLQEGDEVHKAPFSTALTTPRGVQRLTLSQDCRRMLLAMPLLIGLALILLRGCRAHLEAEAIGGA